MLGGAGSNDGEVFSGARFVLFGFDSVSEAQYRSELVRRGGTDVGRYDSSCTHVIVSGHVYDDPVCVAARDDGKVLVTELWIEDSVDFATLADANRILYRPIRDLNGIPGSESLFICLTGYQRRERDDIMKMVDLMGAHFLKPLIATKVTHLICYKFEGEKYELAKRVNIKLVNHRWLEDCLRSWQILPIENYKQSGWELEVMEAESRSSNEEADGNSRERQLTKKSMTAESSRQNSGMSSSVLRLNSLKTSIPVKALTTLQHETTPAELPSTKFEDNIVAHSSLSTCKESNSAGVSSIFDNCNSPGKFDTQDGKGSNETVMKEASLWNSPVTSNDHISSNNEGKKLSLGSVSGGSISSDTTKEKSSPLIYSRKTPRRSVSIEELSRKVCVFPGSSLANDIPSLTLKQEASDIESVTFQNSTTNMYLCHMLGSCNELPQKRMVPKFSSKQPKSGFGNSDVSPLSNSLVNSLSGQLKIPLVNGACQGESDHQLSDEKTLLDVILPACPTTKEGKKSSLCTISGSSMTSDATEEKSSSLIYSRKISRRTVSTESSRKIGVLPRSLLANGIPRLTLKQDPNDLESAGIQIPTTNIDLYHMEGLCSQLPQKRKIPKFSSTSPKSEFGNSDMSALQYSLANSVSAQPEIPLVDGGCLSEPDHQLNDVKSLSHIIIPAYPTASQERGPPISGSATFRKSVKCQSDSKANGTTYLKGQLMESFHNAESRMLLLDQKSTFDALLDLGTQGCALSPTGKLTIWHHDCKPVVVTGVTMNIENAMDNIVTTSIDDNSEDATSPKCKIPKASMPKTPELSFQPDKGEVPELEQSNIQPGETGQARKLKGVASSSCSNADSETGKLSGPTNPSCKSSSRRLTKRVVTRKKLSCRSRLSAGYNTKGKSLVYSNEVVHPNESTLITEQEKGTEREQKDGDENSDTVGAVTKDVIVEELIKEGQNSAFQGDRIGTNRDRVAYLNEKNVVNVSKEIEERILKETTVEKKNGTDVSVPDGVPTGGKLKKSHYRLNNHCTKSASAVSMQASSDAEKENKPAENVCRNRQSDELEGQIITIKCGGKSGQNSTRIDDITNCELQNLLCHKIISQPPWFIFSGPQPQRKEFQKVVRRLKGRLCRDSHNWSYQATHFVVPNPIRRTEKFFAAAASGRWILKSDYLTACNEAGKFLDEEPFEWYGNGVTEDGAINLEAPRKWRLLRERTGHGAFYGMRVIIYGQCIAPSLDTLKRVVKAGDGTILATSPPYTRFLKSGVDFAVVGTSMPHVDTWIQEFLRHDIACVLADYFVEYVCKPGYRLDKYVLYETHSCVEKSVAKCLASDSSNPRIAIMSCSS